METPQDDHRQSESYPSLVSETRPQTSPENLRYRDRAWRRAAVYRVRYSISARRIVSPRLKPSMADRSSVSATKSMGSRTE